MRKRGFSLVETIVSVGIVAAMAAVVVPQVVKQFDASDTTSLQQDLKNLQTAIETFTVNHRSAYPGDMDDLANPIVVSTADTSLTTSGTATSYTSTTYWNGPYIDFTVASGDTKTSGYGALIQDDFVCYIAAGTGANTAGNADGTGTAQACATGDATSRKFLAVRVTGLGDATNGMYQAINDLFDGTSAAELAARATLGRVRNLGSGSSAVTYFLASPLN